MQKEQFENHLRSMIIPFWNALRDDEYGGFYGYVGEDLSVDRKAVKGCILNSRILWFYSRAYIELHDEGLLDYACHAYEFLCERFYDRVNGGVYWSLRYDGTPDDDTKHIYCQAFAIYGLAEYYLASGDRRALMYAWDLFETIEALGFDEYGYKEALGRDFEEVSNDKLSENGVMADRTMNTLLHVYEAYTVLYQATQEKKCEEWRVKSEAVRKKLEWILNTMISKVYNPGLCRQEVFFDNEMHSLIDLQSYGHDIEASWLVDYGLDVLGDATLKAKWAPVRDALVASVRERAYDGHSVANECERGVIDSKRVWWVQAESVLGFYNEYARAGDEQYLADAEAVWQFIRDYVSDHRPGSEWFMHVNPDGTPQHGNPLVDPWKCPYHNGRMCLEMMRKVESKRSVKCEE